MMSPRVELPNRRGHSVFMVEHEGQMFTVGVGQVQTFRGPAAEVFVQYERTSSAVEALARDAAILISLALRHGATLPGIAASMTRDDAERPLTVIGAVLDAMAREFPELPAGAREAL